MSSPFTTGGGCRFLRQSGRELFESRPLLHATTMMHSPCYSSQVRYELVTASKDASAHVGDDALYPTGHQPCLERVMFQSLYRPA